MSVIDFTRRRFAEAESASEVTPLDVLREAVARIEAGEWQPSSVIIATNVLTENGGDFMEMMHGGPANTNERLGILARCQALMLDPSR